MMLRGWWVYKLPANMFRKHFYDGDCLRSEEMEKSALQIVCDACAHGGFDLAKIVSYSRTVLESVPEEARAQKFKSLGLCNG